MKTVKNLIVLITIFSSINLLYAQETKEFRVNVSGKLVVDGLNKVSFEGYDGNEVIISTEVTNTARSERAEGLKLINGTGLEDNTGIGLSVNKVDGNTEVIEMSAKSGRRYTVKVPSSVTVVYSHNTPFGSKVTFKEMQGEIEAKTLHTGIELINVTGPMTISSVHGKIEGNFASVNQKGAISLASSHGLVDVSLPATAKANLQLNSSWGEIYSDLDIEIEKANKEMNNYSSNSVNGSINGGGVDIMVTATHGNIYLRKQ